MPHTFEWLKPSPMWQENGRDMLAPAYRSSFRQPQVLQFESDDFMDEFFAIAAEGDIETFPVAENSPQVTSDTLKLFQPAHRRYYLVCASLCCLVPGFPERVVRQASGESTFFVLRKIFNGKEYGWVVGGNEPLGWQEIDEANPAVLKGEERLPLFSTITGNFRTLMYGYIPVASRETYEARPSELPGEQTGTDARIAELEGRFSNQLTWVDLVEVEDVTAEEGTEEVALRLSVYLMLDLWEYLYNHLQEVAEALRKEDTRSLTGANIALVNFMHTQSLGGSLKLDEALTEVAKQKAVLNNLGDASLPDSFYSKVGGTYMYSLKNRAIDTDGLTEKVDAALQAADVQKAEALNINLAELEATVTIPKLRVDTGENFIVRCVYEQPQCIRRRYWLSQPSVNFELAPFFDPDAPVRPVRISLPEVSASNLRRFKKGVGFIMSEALKDKLNRIGGAQVNMLDSSQSLTELSIGYLCTFSLPIITLCAFILMLVMVFVLNIVFWWLPFFKICLPIPKVSSS
jgi:hypothetical protein